VIAAISIMFATLVSSDNCRTQFPVSAPSSARAYFYTFDPVFVGVAQRRNVDPALLKAIAWCESRFDPCASSGVAHGLMQIVASLCLHQGESAPGSSGRIVRLSYAVASLNESQKQGAVAQAKTAASEVTP
jgi:hypothetical protein